MCPFHNVPAAAPIPPALVTVARDDPRVPLWGPLKWVARLRDSRRAWDARHPQVLCLGRHIPSLTRGCINCQPARVIAAYKVCQKCAQTVKNAILSKHPSSTLRAHSACCSFLLTVCSLLQTQVTGNRFKAAAAPDAPRKKIDAAAPKRNSTPFDGASNIVVRITDTGGHFGEASRRYQDAAQNYAFLINAVKGRRKPKHA